jgi:hypothetical protein
MSDLLFLIGCCLVSCFILVETWNYDTPNMKLLTGDYIVMVIACLGLQFGLIAILLSIFAKEYPLKKARLY